MLLLSSADFAA